MPRTRVVIYREEDGSAPFLPWLLSLPAAAQDKVRVKVERLRELGQELRRPEGDYLRDGIYELRASARGVHYRVLLLWASSGGSSSRNSEGAARSRPAD